MSLFEKLVKSSVVLPAGPSKPVSVVEEVYFFFRSNFVKNTACIVNYADGLLYEMNCCLEFLTNLLQYKNGNLTTPSNHRFLLIMEILCKYINATH